MAFIDSMIQQKQYLGGMKPVCKRMHRLVGGPEHQGAPAIQFCQLPSRQRGPVGHIHHLQPSAHPEPHCAFNNVKTITDLAEGMPTWADSRDLATDTLSLVNNFDQAVAASDAGISVASCRNIEADT